MSVISEVSLLDQSLATALFPSSPEKTALRDLPSPSDTSNIAPLPCINIIQARSRHRILPCVWTPYSSDLTSKTRPEMTAEYTILSFPLDNMRGCPAFPEYLENNLILLCRKHWEVVRYKNIQQSKGKAPCTLHHRQENLDPNSVNILISWCADDSERYLTK